MPKPFPCSSARNVGILAALLVLAGCGGGGGDEVPSPAIPLAAAFGNFVSLSAAYQITYTGTATTATGQQLPFTGTGTASEHTVTTTFGGLPALRKDVTQSGQFQILGTSYPVTSTSTSYFDTRYAPLASTGDEGYCVVTSHTALPETARAGHNSAWFSSTCYSDASKAVQIGRVSTSWVVEAYSGTVARFKVLTKLTDTTGATANSTLAVLVNTAGQITRESETGTLSQDGITLKYEGTYR